MTVDIILTAWKRYNFTKMALESIKKNTPEQHRITVIDNGSEDWEIYMKWRKDGLIDNLVLLDKNYGLEYAKHLGMAFVDSSLFVSTDNDILASPGWLGRLMDLMDLHPDYGAIACRPQILVATGDIFKGVTTDVLSFDHVPGYLRLMKTDLVNKVGAWKDKRPLRGHEEHWISQKLQELGYKTGWAVNVPCYHLFGAANDWGYTGMTAEEHGHHPVWPLPADNLDEVKKYQ